MITGNVAVRTRGEGPDDTLAIVETFGLDECAVQRHRAGGAPRVGFHKQGAVAVGNDIELPLSAPANRFNRRQWQERGGCSREENNNKVMEKGNLEMRSISHWTYGSEYLDWVRMNADMTAETECRRNSWKKVGAGEIAVAVRAWGEENNNKVMEKGNLEMHSHHCHRPPSSRFQQRSSFANRDPASLPIRHPAALLSSRDDHRVEPASSSPNLDKLAEPASHSPPLFASVLFCSVCFCLLLFALCSTILFDLCWLFCYCYLISASLILYKKMEQSQSNSQPQDNAAQNSQIGSSRGKSDPAWQYFTVRYDKNNKAQYTCIFCLNTYNGGGIYRMKYHLAKIPGQIKVCNKVTEDVELQFKRLLEENKKNKAEKRKFTSECYDVESEREAEEEGEAPNPVQPPAPATMGDKGKRRAIAATPIGSYFKERTTPGSQPALKSVLASKQVKHKVKLGLARWIIDARIPFNAIQSPYFQPALDGVAAIGPGFKGPSYDEMRVHLLADLKKECQLLVEGYRSSWKRTGCTLMADGWTDQRQRMQRAKINIKTMFRNRKSAYTPYTSILKMRWDKHLKRDLHAAAYFLNPDYFYSEGFVEKANILRSLLDLFDIETLCNDSVAAMQEIQLYRDRKGSFGRESALKAITRLEPGEWWRLHGGSAPNLQKMAIRLLHQTSSSSGCERNWSLFEQIHSKRRNRLEHQRLSDIVYVTYNLRLQSRMHRKKKNYDPIDIQSIDTVDFWVMPDEEDPEFTNGDIEGIENLIYTDNAMPSYPTDGGDVELDVDFPNVADSSNTASFGGTSDDGGFGLPVYDGDVGTLNDNYDF
ncbi:uncharacterized protein [Arachis hypogaea]|uniref:uncharacterized protein n=1 Tax=Arachis hypogaea TaxID=3818 RepID=UPI003B21491C